MLVDCWNYETFDDELTRALEEHDETIVTYHREGIRLMHEYLNSDPYESLKENRFYSRFMDVQENVVTPILKRKRIRLWHYSRLTDDEVSLLSEGLTLSSVDFLKERISRLVAQKLLSENDAEIIVQDSPLKKQISARVGRMFMVVTPVNFQDSGVKLLLESWGGESAYFWMSDEGVAEKLKNIGEPRIVEIESGLSDRLNAYKVSTIVIQAWAKKSFPSVSVDGCDLSISDCLKTARVIRIHTSGDETFEAVGTSYPDRCDDLICVDLDK